MKSQAAAVVLAVFLLLATFVAEINCFQPSVKQRKRELGGKVVLALINIYIFCFVLFCFVFFFF